jgi:hypothetical protein
MVYIMKGARQGIFRGIVPEGPLGWCLHPEYALVCSRRCVGAPTDMNSRSQDRTPSAQLPREICHLRVLLRCDKWIERPFQCRPSNFPAAEGTLGGRIWVRCFFVTPSRKFEILVDNRDARNHGPLLSRLVNLQARLVES